MLRMKGLEICMNKEKMKHFFSGVLLIAIIFIYYLSISLKYPVNSDDAALPYLFERTLQYGETYSFSGDLSIFRLINFFTYLIFGISDYSIYFACAISITIISSLSLVLICKKINTKKDLIFRVLCYFAVSVMITPKASYYWRYHSTSVIITLLLLLVADQIISKGSKKVYLFIIGLLCILGFMPKDFIFLCIGIVPLAIAFYSQYLLKKDKKTTLIPIFVLTVCSLTGIILYGIAIRNENMDLVSEAYFGTNFITLNELGRNIKLYITGILDLFGANFQGKSMLSLDAVKCVSKILLLLYGFYKCIINCIWAFCYKEKDILFIDTCLSFSVIVLSVIFIFADTTSSDVHTRYLNSFIPFLGIIISRGLYDDIANKGKILWKYGGLTICRIHEFAAFILFLILLNFQSLTFQPVYSMYSDLADVLLKNNLIYGLAPYWSANSTNVISNNQVELKGVIIGDPFSEYFVGQSSLLLENLSPNFIVTAVEEGEYGQDGGYDEAYILSRFGKPVQIYQSQNHRILLYDYDLSVPPKLINNTDFTDGMDFVCTDNDTTIMGSGTLTYSFLAEKVGYYRIRIYGNNLSNLGLYIDTSESSFRPDYAIKNEDGKEYAEIKFCIHSTESKEFDLTLLNQSAEQDLQVSCMVMVRENNKKNILYNSQDISYSDELQISQNNSIEMYSPVTEDGYKLLYIHGDNLSEASISVFLNNSSIDYETIWTSRKLLVLQIQNDKNGEVCIQVENNSRKKILINEAFISISENV